MTTTTGRAQNALSGLLIADFSWVIAGPVGTKFLADYGATVVKIESRTRPDTARTNAPYKDGVPGINRSGYYGFLNGNKLSLSLNLKNPRAREVVRRLVKKADVVVENYTPGTMAGWGLGYEDLKKIKPDIIMLSLSMQGQTGPHSSHLGYGIELQGYAGFTAITGWPDREVVQPYGALTDLLAPVLGASAILAALEHRRETGEGRHLDVSQVEAGIYALTPLMLDYFANGHIAQPLGNVSNSNVPYGAYRCRGNDRWCAIEVTNADWKLFLQAIGNPAWASEARFATAIGRVENKIELDRLVETWTAQHTAEEVVSRLQAAGIISSVVNNPKETYEDPQLAFREFFKVADHPEIGQFAALGPCCLLSESKAAGKPAPILGEHTEYVCRDILGMSDEEFIELFNAGVFE